MPTARQRFSIGDVYLNGYAAPEVLRVLRQQRVVVHEYVGGGRSVQVLGPQMGPIRWSGKLVPEESYQISEVSAFEVTSSLPPLNDPIFAALTMASMYQSGNMVPLIYGQIALNVVISDFDYDIRNINEVDYTITCVVVEDLTTPTPRVIDPFAQLEIITRLGFLSSVLDFLQKAEIFAILAIEEVKAIRTGNARLIALGAIIIADKVNGTFNPFGPSIIDTANEILHIAALVQAAADAI